MDKGTDFFAPSAFNKMHTKAFSYLKLLSNFSHLAHIFYELKNCLWKPFRETRTKNKINIWAMD